LVVVKAKSDDDNEKQKKAVESFLLLKRTGEVALLSWGGRLLLCKVYLP
jgi:hypothetical protein